MKVDMRPISSRFLNGSATYKPVSGKDAYNKPTFGTDVPISRFLALVPKKTMVSSMGEQADDRLEIYFDVMKSLPHGHTFVKGGYVVYNSETYIVRETQIHPTPDKPHHYLVRLT